MRDEAVRALISDTGGLYVDATFGRGGHSELILQRLSDQGRLLAFDQDPDAIDYAREHFAEDQRLTVVHSNYSELASVVQKEFPAVQLDGALFDLGVSSPQLDQAERGFSFSHSGPLDMRMDKSRGQTLGDWLKQVDADTLAEIFRNYGEERYARRIARRVVSEVSVGNIHTTVDLAEAIKQAHPRWERNKHPATRCFQALRIFVNRELEHLQIALEQTSDLLRPGAQLVVISFHSLEDRLVKRFIRGVDGLSAVPRGLPVKVTQKLKAIGKAVRPSASEIEVNPRARSSVMRVAVKL